MTDSHLILLGWNVKITPEGLVRKEVEFMTNYEIELLKKYTSEGNYISSHPFGIGKTHDSLYIVYDTESKFVSVSTNPIVNIQDSGIDSDCSAFSTYVVTSIHKKLAEAGYERQIDVKSFLGKVKGLCRNKRLETMRLKTKFTGSDLDFIVCQAEKFTIIETENDEVLVLYSPRHEISENLYGLSSKSIIPDEISEDERLVRTPDNAMSRFNTVSSYLTNQINIHIQLDKISNFPYNQLNRPSLRFPNGRNISLQDDSSLTFERVMSSEFSCKMSIPISIVYDCTGKSSSISAMVKEFGKEISDTLSTEVSFFALKETEKLESLNDSVIILVVDDTVPGSHPIYDFVKSATNLTSKAIRLSTLVNEGVKETSKLVALAIRYRLSGDLYQNVSEKDSIETLGISLIPYRKGNHLLLTGSLLTGDRLVQSYQLLWNERALGTPTEVQLSDFLKNMGVTETKSNLVILTDNSTNLLHNLSNLYDDISIVHISDLDSIMLNKTQESVYVPHDGCYVNIDSNTFLLTTNGFPDVSKGVPSPIHIKFIQNHHIDTSKILKRLYFETFLHPSSFAKPKLPVSLHASTNLRLPKRRIFTENHEVGYFI